jgi:hypothetical protein
MTKELEKGSAEIIVQLKRGFIYVYHSEDKQLLHKRPAQAGDWASLWDELSKAERTGINVLSSRNFSFLDKFSKTLAKAVLILAPLYFLITIILTLNN